MKASNVRKPNSGMSQQLPNFTGELDSDASQIYIKHFRGKQMGGKGKGEIKSLKRRE